MFFQLTFAALTLTAATLTRASTAPLTQLGKTALTGVSYVNNTVEFYGGIPYAEPPLGNLRWKSPVLQTRLNATTFDATQYGSKCLQPAADPGSEDCLTINVYRPAGLPENAALPVMAWIHGGGFKIGASSGGYNATALIVQSVARGTPIVYVSFNYRLGPLGFPPGVEAEAKDALNLGLRDQLTALKWVQENIGVFGGDKNKVTVFGESAGAISVAVLYLNSNLKGLARAVILESGSASTGIVFDSHRRQIDWDNFIHAIPECANSGNSSFSCLRGGSVSTSEILQAVEAANSEADKDYPWMPTLDGPHGLLPDLPSVLLEEGRFTRIPLMTGTNLDEGTFFTNPLINSTAMIDSYTISNYSSPVVAPLTLAAAVDRILELYPDIPALGAPFGTGNATYGLSQQWKRFSAITGDLMFHAPRREMTQKVRKFDIDVFAYLFTDPGAKPIVSPFFANEPESLDNLGVTHTGEVPYIYNFTSAIGDPTTAIPLAEQMVDYWLSFATSLNPNDGHGTQRPTWSKYTGDRAMILQLNSANTSMILDDYRETQISFINANAKIWSH